MIRNALKVGLGVGRVSSDVEVHCLEHCLVNELAAPPGVVWVRVEGDQRLCGGVPREGLVELQLLTCAGNLQVLPLGGSEGDVRVRFAVGDDIAPLRFAVVGRTPGYRGFEALEGVVDGRVDVRPEAQALERSGIGPILQG